MAVGVGIFVLVNKNNTPSYEIVNPQTPASIEQAKYDRKHPFFIGKTFAGNAKQINNSNNEQQIVWTVSISFNKNHTFQQYADNANNVSAVVQGRWKLVHDNLKLIYSKKGYTALYNQNGKDLAQGLPYDGQVVSINKHGSQIDKSILPDFEIKGNIIKHSLLLKNISNKNFAAMSTSDGQPVATVSKYRMTVEKQILQQVAKITKSLTIRQQVAASLLSYRDAIKANRRVALKVQKLISDKKQVYVQTKKDVWLIANSKKATPFLAIKVYVDNGISYANVKKIDKKTKINNYQSFANANLKTFIPKYILQQDNNFNNQQDYLTLQKNIKLVK